MQHFTDLDKIDSLQLHQIIDNAIKIKSELKKGEFQKPLLNKQMAMIFEKPSTRTRASFEVGMNQLGGNSIVLNTENSQLGRGEKISDTAQVLSRYVDVMMIRCFKHETLLELSENASVPVINGLTDYSHPCQIMADIMTYVERRGSIKNKIVTWVGDGNNVTTSWIHAASQFEFDFRISTPKELKPADEIMQWAKDKNAKVQWFENPEDATRDSDLVMTDTWVSMGDKDVQERKKLLTPFQVNKSLMSLAKSDALFMHCLPAHRNDEVTDEVMDGPQSVVFDEAENRLHVQKSIIIWCLNN